MMLNSYVILSRFPLRTWRPHILGDISTVVNSAGLGPYGQRNEELGSSEVQSSKLFHSWLM